MDATVAALREELRALQGPARVPVLGQLGQHLSQVYWRAGIGRPGALADLSEAIEALDEAYQLVEEADRRVGQADPARGQIAGQLGHLLAARYGTHGGGPGDGERGWLLLREAVSYPTLPPTMVPSVRFLLGQLLMGRVLDAMQPDAARGGFAWGLSPSLHDDVDEAVRQYQAVIEGPLASPEVKTLAGNMLTLT